MTFMDSIQVCFSKYVVWKGRASRSEYWWFFLFVLGANIVLSFADAALFGVGTSGKGILGGVFSLATFLPSLSAMVRRLHDNNRSGWWFWIILIPVVGWIVLLVFLALQGSERDNDYGMNPIDENETPKSSVPWVTRD